MSSDGVNAECSVDVPPLGGQEDSKDFISENWGGGMVVVIFDGGLGGNRAVSYERVN